MGDRVCFSVAWQSSVRQLQVGGLTQGVQGWRQLLCCLRRLTWRGTTILAVTQKYMPASASLEEAKDKKRTAYITIFPQPLHYL